MSEGDRLHEVRWFPSKTDGWLLAALTIPPISALLTLIGAVQAGRLGLALVPVTVVLVVYLGLLFPTEYGIDDTHLVVRAGFVRVRVPLARIRAVRPTQMAWSAPALSLDRLEVRWGDGPFECTRIAPREREQFVELLAKKADLTRDGLELTRIDG